MLCRERAEVATFVQRSDLKDSNWYIVPLCKTHSRLQGTLEISSFMPLVSADVGETCDKCRALPDWRMKEEGWLPAAG